MSGPASCTSCNPLGCNPHFTIMDPKTNTGTCTAQVCPTCKPSSCCDPSHKHYVLNTKSLEGVCVRHNDDCTPVCVPPGSEHKTNERSVCSKGCNRMLKILKKENATTEEEMYDMIVCQADKRVICDPQNGQMSCRATSSFKAQARCTFKNSIWSLGPTCVAHHVTQEPHPQCPDGVDTALIKNITQTCSPTVEKEDKLCSRLGMTF